MTLRYLYRYEMEPPMPKKPKPKVEPTPPNRQNHCGWCGLLGHTRVTCHVKRDRRREPDLADKIACEVTSRCTPSDDRTNRPDPLLMRQEVAALVREYEAKLAALGAPTGNP